MGKHVKGGGRGRRCKRPSSTPAASSWWSLTFWRQIFWWSSPPVRVVPPPPSNGGEATTLAPSPERAPPPETTPLAPSPERVSPPPPVPERGHQAWLDRRREKKKKGRRNRENQLIVDGEPVPNDVKDAYIEYCQASSILRHKFVCHICFFQEHDFTKSNKIMGRERIAASMFALIVIFSYTDTSVTFYRPIGGDDQCEKADWWR
uniref:Uncharacterized protein n=1 Tax=Leersia perrieri TaxID=77586 RepID=A0A0D9XTK2_9ORYZ